MIFHGNESLSREKSLTFSHSRIIRESSIKHQALTIKIINPFELKSIMAAVEAKRKRLPTEDSAGTEMLHRDYRRYLREHGSDRLCARHGVSTAAQESALRRSPDIVVRTSRCYDFDCFSLTVSILGRYPGSTCGRPQELGWNGGGLS